MESELPAFSKTMISIEGWALTPPLSSASLTGITRTALRYAIEKFSPENGK